MIAAAVDGTGLSVADTPLPGEQNLHVSPQIFFIADARLVHQPKLLNLEQSPRESSQVSFFSSSSGSSNSSAGIVRLSVNSFSTSTRLVGSRSEEADDVAENCLLVGRLLLC